MALIGKIRDKSWLVLIFVGVALLTFLFSDWSSLLGGSGYEFGYGTIYGEMIDMDAWQDKQTELRKKDELKAEIAQLQNQQFQPTQEDDMWRIFVQDLVLEREYEALGIHVSDEEFNAYMYAEKGFKPLPIFSNFTDSLGNIDKVKLNEQFKEMEKSDLDKRNLASIKEDLRKQRQQEKYRDIIKQGAYVTKLQAKRSYLEMTEVKNISFVYQRFNTVEDDKVAVDDAKLKAYFEKNKSKKIYEQKKAVHTISYLTYRFDPSSEDSAKFIDNLTGLRGGLINAENDSNFIVQNSELRFYSSGPFSTTVPQGHSSAQQLRSYPRGMDSLFMNSAVGDVIGPYEVNGKSCISKVIGFTEDTINARHILLSVNQDGSNLQAQEALADSILKVINKDNFVEYVNKYSADPSSKEKNGELGDFFFATMVPQFATYCADEPIGKIGKVRSQFGFHIIEVLDRRGNKYPRLATIEKTLKASPEAVIEIKQEVTDLLFDLSDRLAKEADLYKKVTLFDTLVSQKKLSDKLRRVEIIDNSPEINGLQMKKTVGDLLEMAYSEDAKVGDLVGSPIQDKDSYIIAILTGAFEKGPASFDNPAIKKMVRMNYINEKKAEIIEKRFANVKSLEALVLPEKNINVEEAQVTFGAGVIGNVSNEKRVAGIIFSGIADGKMTKVIRGEYGIFLIKINSTNPAEEKPNYIDEQANLLQAQKSQIEGSMVSALIELADVIDNRKFLEKGIRL